MEQQEEEKKRKVYRKQSKSDSSFPVDLISEILLRLPTESVARFRCVSKLWLSITTDSYFINSFETRASTLRPSLLVCFKEGEKLFVSSIPQHRHDLNGPTSSSEPIYRYSMELPMTNEYCFSSTESVHGLICFQESATPIVWNPNKKQFLTLPKPRKSWKEITIFLGYDPIEGKHKVMCIPYKRSSDVCRVLTLGTAEESWRTVKTNHKHRSDYITKGRCIKGVIYYLAYIFQRRNRVIMSFDVRNENFGMIDLPSDIYRNMLINYEGRLACGCVNKNTGKSSLWILEDAENHKWSSKYFEPFYHYDKSSRTISELKGFTLAGELIYVPSFFRKSYSILFYDPVRKLIRRFSLQGIVDDESRPTKGVEAGFVIPFHTFPNFV